MWHEVMWRKADIEGLTIGYVNIEKLDRIGVAQSYKYTRDKSGSLDSKLCGWGVFGFIQSREFLLSKVVKTRKEAEEMLEVFVTGELNKKKEEDKK